MNEVLLKSIVPVIGDILKRYREKTRKKQGEVASKAGISISMLSQIERGVVSASIDTLFSVCSAVGIDIADLFRRISPEAPARVQKSGERLSTEHHGVLFEQLATSSHAGFPAELLLLEVKSGERIGLSGKGHEGIEMGFVLEGSALLTVKDADYRLEKGDSVSFNAELPHGLVNIGKKTFRAVWTALPPHKDYLGE
jgi:transcriptional regulator with XRE-family HTH domain